MTRKSIRLSSVYDHGSLTNLTNLSARFACVGLLLSATWVFAQVEVEARFRYSGSFTKLPTADLFHPLVGSSHTDNQLDARVQFSGDQESLSWYVDSTFSLLHGDGIELENLLQLPNEARRGSQAYRRFDLASRLLDKQDTSIVAAIDRAVLQYRKKTWSIKVGRDALSWGNGVVFHPLDLFSPFAPTTVDREFKTSSDLVLVEKLFSNGSDLQALYIGRSDTGTSSNDSSTKAIKYKGLTESFEYEFVLADHYSDPVLAASLQAPIGGALLRTDLVRSCGSSQCFNSGIVNLDYTFSLKGAPLYAFVEFFHNAFGVKRLTPGNLELPSFLVERQERGEVFNLMKRYVAVGAVFPLHPLWNQTVTGIRNSHDGGMLIQTFLTYDPSDHTRVQLGILAPLADEGEEFGQLSVDDESTSGGGWNVFVSLAYYL